MKSLWLIILHIIHFSVAHAQINNVNDAKQFSNNGQYQIAIEIYENLDKSELYQDAIFEEYFNLLIKTKNISKAEKLLQEAANKNQISSAIKFNQAYLAAFKGDSILADKLFMDIIKKLPADESSVVNVANKFIERELYTYAILSFVQGRKELKNSSAFAIDLANLYAFKSDKENLIREVFNLIDLNPDYLGFAKMMISKNYHSQSELNSVIAEINKRIQRNPDKVIYNEFATFILIQQRKFDLAIDQLMLLEKKNLDQSAQIFSVGEISLQNFDFTSAQKAFTYLLGKGKDNIYYLDALILSLKAQTELIKKGNQNNAEILNLIATHKFLIKQYGINRKTYEVLISLFNIYLNNPNHKNEAILLLESAVNANQLDAQEVAQLKLLLANQYMLADNFWDAKLLLSQVEKEFKNESLGQQARFFNAKISFYLGEFKWAKSQLDILKASTSQNISNDSFDLSVIISNGLEQDSTGNFLNVLAKADLYFEKRNFSKALNSLDSAELNPKFTAMLDYTSILKGKIFAESKQYKLAAETYNQIIAKYHDSIFRDDAIFLLAKLQENIFKLPDEAIINYSKVINEYATSAHVQEAKERVRMLSKTD